MYKNRGIWVEYSPPPKKTDKHFIIYKECKYLKRYITPPQNWVRFDCTSLYLILYPLKFELTYFNTMIELTNIFYSFQSQTVFLENWEHLSINSSVSPCSFNALFIYVFCNLPTTHSTIMNGLYHFIIQCLMFRIYLVWSQFIRPNCYMKT